MNSKGHRGFGYTDIRQTFRDHFINASHCIQCTLEEVVSKTHTMRTMADAGDNLSSMSIPAKAEIQAITSRYKPGKGVANEYAKTNTEG